MEEDFRQVPATDGTSAACQIDWPHDMVILEPPGCCALWQGHARGCVAVYANDPCELRAYGFSPSRRMLILASSADLRLYVRDSAGNTV